MYVCVCVCVFAYTAVCVCIELYWLDALFALHCILLHRMVWDVMANRRGRDHTLRGYSKPPDFVAEVSPKDQLECLRESYA